MNDHLIPPLPGTRAPDFTLPRTLYESVSLHDVHGHPTILDAAGMVRWSRGYPTNLNPGVHSILSALETLHVRETTQ